MSWALKPVTEATTHVADLQGEYYLKFLERLHAALTPKTYFEVGTYEGESLALAGCPSIAVDPVFRGASGRIGGKQFCGFYQMTSDDFFAAHSPSAIFGRPIDLAFLDGLHLAEALLRDIVNVERHCKSNSVVAIHDCVPVDLYIAERMITSERRQLGVHPEWWTGDVWKVLPILRRLRPDLSIHVVDASPTGLVLLTNLDPHSTVLADTYAANLREIRGMDLEAYGLARLIGELELESTAAYGGAEDFAARFWL